jgi:septum formation protein
MRQIILASQSPRRRELLTQIGLKFTVHPSTGEEKITSDDPVQVVQELSLQKAQDVYEQHIQIKAADSSSTDSFDAQDILVIGADTIVVYEGRILGKPSDRQDAVRMLSMLQGNEHSVYTGVTLLSKDRTRTFAEETKVTMYPMSGEEIEWYVDTKEPMDKAGAYGIQGYCARFIEKIQGDYNTVVGLPVGRIYQELMKTGEVR